MLHTLQENELEAKVYVFYEAANIATQLHTGNQTKWLDAYLRASKIVPLIAA